MNGEGRSTWRKRDECPLGVAFDGYGEDGENGEDGKNGEDEKTVEA